MIDENQQYAYFTITGGFDPAEITRRVGVQPSESWRRGDICPHRQMELKFSRWTLKSRLGRNQKLEAHIRDVLAQLDDNQETFRELSLELDGCMQFVAHFHRDYPGLHFDRDITWGLVRYSLAVDFDFYGLYSHRREGAAYRME